MLLKERANVQVMIDDTVLTIMKTQAGYCNEENTPPDEISYTVVFEDAMGKVSVKVMKFRELYKQTQPIKKEEKAVVDAIRALN